MHGPNLWAILILFIQSYYDKINEDIGYISESGFTNEKKNIVNLTSVIEYMDANGL